MYHLPPLFFLFFFFPSSMPPIYTHFDTQSLVISLLSSFHGKLLVHSIILRSAHYKHQITTFFFFLFLIFPSMAFSSFEEFFIYTTRKIRYTRLLLMAFFPCVVHATRFILFSTTTTTISIINNNT